MVKQNIHKIYQFILINKANYSENIIKNSKILYNNVNPIFILIDNKNKKLIKQLEELNHKYYMVSKDEKSLGKSLYEILKNDKKIKDDSLITFTDAYTFFNINNLKEEIKKSSIIYTGEFVLIDIIKDKSETPLDINSSKVKTGIVKRINNPVKNHKEYTTGICTKPQYLQVLNSLSYNDYIKINELLKDICNTNIINKYKFETKGLKISTHKSTKKQKSRNLYDELQESIKYMNIDNDKNELEKDYNPPKVEKKEPDILYTNYKYTIIKIKNRRGR